jgi:hypothetical protein
VSLDPLSVAGAREGAKLLPEVYKDALQPAMREVGTTLGRVVRMSLAGVRGAAWSWERAEAWVEATVEERLHRRKTPEERVIPPPPQLAAGVIRGVQAVGDDGDGTLRDLFANLLATAMDRESAILAHPAYASILSQITPDEAKILLAVGSNRYRRILWKVTTYLVKTSGQIDYSSQQAFVPLKKVVDLENPFALESYVDNLARLGILTRDESSYHSDLMMSTWKEEGLDSLSPYMLDVRQSFADAGAEALSIFEDFREATKKYWHGTHNPAPQVFATFLSASSFGAGLLEAVTDSTAPQTTSEG